MATFTITETGSSAGNLTAAQNAVNAAAPGDTIFVTAGIVCAGTLFLVAKANPNGLYITIRTTTSDGVLPPGTRVTASQAPLMPRFVVTTNNTQAIRTAFPPAVASYYALVGLEVQASTYGSRALVELGSSDGALPTKQTSTDLVPHHFRLDRCYIHGRPLTGQLRGVELHARAVVITECAIQDIWSIGQDCQAIAGWNGIGDYTITNTLCEAGGEGIMMGGSDPLILGLVPRGLVITRCDVQLPLAWRSPILAQPGGVTATASSGTLPAASYTWQVQARRTVNQARTAKSAISAPVSLTLAANGGARIAWAAVADAGDYLIYRTGPNGTVRYTTTATFFLDSGSAGTAEVPTNTTGHVRTVKNLLEFKNFDTALVRGNRFTYCWKEGQVGYPILLTPKNQDGGNPATTVRNITFEYNRVTHAPGGVSMTSHDGGGHVSARSANFIFRYNLFSDIGPQWGATLRDFIVGADDSGTNPREGIAGLTIEHNTSISAGMNAWLYFYDQDAATLVYDKLSALVVKNNIARRTTSGVDGEQIGEGTVALTAYAPGFTWQQNALAVAAAVVGNYPPTTLVPTEVAFEAAFVNYAGGNYRAATGGIFFHTATDGLDMGADINMIDALYAGGSAPACTYALGAPSTTVVAGGGSGTVALTTGASCVWTVTSDAAWLTVTSAGAGLGSATVAWTAAVNLDPTAGRVGHLTIGGQTYTITQAAAAPLPPPPDPSPVPLGWATVVITRSAAGAVKFQIVASGPGAPQGAA